MDRIRIIVLFCSCVLASAACAATGEVPSSSASESNGGASGETNLPLTTTWCAARTVLEQKCQRCHGAEPDYGAPFSLVTYEDTQVANAKGKLRYELIAAAVSSDYMPPSFLQLTPEVEPLTEQERTTLLDWCDAGAPGPDQPDCDEQ